LTVDDKDDIKKKKQDVKRKTAHKAEQVTKKKISTMQHDKQGKPSDVALC